MYLDAFTLSALVDEYMDTLVGGKIQNTLDVDANGVGMEIYANRQRRYLYLSADNNRPHLLVTPEKLRRGMPKLSPVALVLRSYAEGGRIVHISQPAWERVVHFHIEGEKGEIEIIIEPMERRANVLVVQGGKIIDCMRRVGPDDNRYRLSLPAHDYQPPPPMIGRRNPFDVTADDIRGFMMVSEDPKRKMFQALSGNLLGFSPLIAREIVFRACGDTSQRLHDADPDALYDALREVTADLRRREWRPGVVGDDESGVSAYSVYPIQHLDGWQAVESINGALLAYYGAPAGADAYDNAKKPVQAAIKTARGKLQAKRDSLASALKDDSEREQLRQSGELLLAYQYTLEKGQTELVAQYDMDAPPLHIQIDPTLSPLDNAQRYFNRYNKAKRALEDVPALIEETDMALAHLDQLEMDLEVAANWPEIDDVQQALQAGGYWQGRKAQRIGGGQSAPIRVVSRDGFVIWVGRNSRQNEIVTFKKSNAEDLWLHARQVPGAHVIIKFDGRPIPEDLIEQAAGIAAYYSKRRADGRVPVDVTRIKYVKKIKGAAQGMVTYRNERTLNVAPISEDDIERA